MVMNVHSENCKKSHRIPPPRVNTIKLFDSFCILKLKSVRFLQKLTYYIFAAL